MHIIRKARKKISWWHALEICKHKTYTRSHVAAPAIQIIQVVCDLATVDCTTSSAKNTY